MRFPRPRCFQFSLRTLLCAHLTLGALLGVAFWSWPYYRAWKIVEGWSGMEFANVGDWSTIRREFWDSPKLRSDCWLCIPRAAEKPAFQAAAL